MKMSFSFREGRLHFLALAFVLASTAVHGQVISRNVVGYVNSTLLNGYSFLANPLDAGTNRLSTLMRSAPEGSRAYQWDVTNQVFLTPSVKVSSSAWTIDYEFPVGRGFVVFSPTQWTNTFVGNVLDGRLTNFVAGADKFSLLGSMIPAANPISDSFLTFPGTEGDQAYLFRHDLQQFTQAYAFFDGHGWFDPEGVAGTDGPVLPVAHSFFVHNPGPDKLWIQDFSFFDRAASEEADRSAPGPRISGLSISGQTVTLQVENPDGEFNVLFSADGTAWTTVAARQTGAIWSGPLPDAAHGCFQLVKP